MMTMKCVKVKVKGAELDLWSAQKLAKSSFRPKLNFHDNADNRRQIYKSILFLTNLLQEIPPDNHSVLKSQCTADDDDGGKGEGCEEEEEEEEEGRGGGGGGRRRWRRGGGSRGGAAEGVLCDHPLLLPILVSATHPGEKTQHPLATNFEKTQVSGFQS